MLIRGMFCNPVMSKGLVFVLFCAVFFGACVPNKKILYLQKGEELKEDFPKDSILRTYDLADYEYRIQPEDILSVRFESLSVEEYDIFSSDDADLALGNQNNLVIAGYLVDKDGNIEFPEIGKVKVAGMTIHESQVKLQSLAESYVEEPVVKVRLLNFRVSVLGEVLTEGIVTSFNNRLTVMEAIALAGGLGDLADRSNVKIIRQRNGKSEVFYVNLLEEKFMQSSFFFVHQNDIIIVPPLKQRPYRQYFGQNLSLILSSVATILLMVNIIITN